MKFRRVPIYYYGLTLLVALGSGWALTQTNQNEGYYVGETEARQLEEMISARSILDEKIGAVVGFLSRKYKVPNGYRYYPNEGGFLPPREVE